MRCIDGENELILTCETQAEGVCILRCETRDPVVLLPDEIDGAPVTALGRYVLSGRAPDLSGRDTFSVRVTCGGPLPVHEADSIRAVTLPKHISIRSTMTGPWKSAPKPPSTVGDWAASRFPARWKD